jgi:hypothetical protein
MMALGWHQGACTEATPAIQRLLLLRVQKVTIGSKTVHLSRFSRDRTIIQGFLSMTRRSP